MEGGKRKLIKKCYLMPGTLLYLYYINRWVIELFSIPPSPFLPRGLLLSPGLFVCEYSSADPIIYSHGKKRYILELLGNFSFRTNFVKKYRFVELKICRPFGSQVSA
jgi:hypothetical protein